MSLATSTCSAGLGTESSFQPFTLEFFDGGMAGALSDSLCPWGLRILEDHVSTILTTVNFTASERRPHPFDSIGRGGEIRTHDPLRPRQVRYQAALRPDM